MKVDENHNQHYAEHDDAITEVKTEALNSVNASKREPKDGGNSPKISRSGRNGEGQKIKSRGGASTTMRVSDNSLDFTYNSQKQLYV